MGSRVLKLERQTPVQTKFDYSPGSLKALGFLWFDCVCVSLTVCVCVCGEGYSSLGLVGDLQVGKLKIDPYKYQCLRKKWPIHDHKPIGPMFGQILSKNHQILPQFSWIWVNLGSNFGKFWKIDPFLYQILHFMIGHSYIKTLILLPIQRYKGN